MRELGVQHVCWLGTGAVPETLSLALTWVSLVPVLSVHGFDSTFLGPFITTLSEASLALATSPEDTLSPLCCGGLFLVCRPAWYEEYPRSDQLPIEVDFLVLAIARLDGSNTERVIENDGNDGVDRLPESRPSNLSMMPTRKQGRAWRGKERRCTYGTVQRERVSRGWKSGQRTFGSGRERDAGQARANETPARGRE